jgi:hypothetical protein
MAASLFTTKTAPRGPTVNPAPGHDLASMSGDQFLTVLFLVLALAAWAAASGVHSLAAMRRGVAVARAKRAAAAPIPYRASLASLGPLLGPQGGTVALVRADSAAPWAGALCALAREATVEVRWVALSPDVPRCIRALRPADAGAARAALHGARWVLVAPDRRVLYSHRGVPSAAEVGEIAALLAVP